MNAQAGIECRAVQTKSKRGEPMMWHMQLAGIIAVAMMIIFVLAICAWAELWSNLQRPSNWVLGVMFVQGTLFLFVQFVNFAAAWRTLVQYEKDNMPQTEGGEK